MKAMYQKLVLRLRLLLMNDFLKFIISGVLSVIIEFFILILLVETFKVNYLVANTLSFIITNIFNYLLSRLWVFGKSNRRIRYELLLFFSTTSIGLIINQIVMWLMVDNYHFNYKLAKLLAIIIVVLWNFWSKKFLVFTNKIKKQDVEA